jgi:predicted lipid-binding transport protein (Tim44 family)
MKKLIIGLLFASFLALGLSMNAQAKRLGGGRSFGKQSSLVSPKQLPPPQPIAPVAKPATPAPAPVTPAPVPSRGFGWGGMLGGLAAGIGLGWLLSHFGLGEAASTFLMGLLVVMLASIVFMWFFRRFFGGAAQYQVAPASNSNWSNDGAYLRQEPVVTANSYDIPPVQNSAVIADFDQAAFLLNAKKYFVRLQEAWDSGDLSQLNEFATPEMFEELRQDLQARLDQNNKTEVLTLEAEMLGLEELANVYLASVRFSGMIRERADLPVESFVEIWNLTKPVTGQGGWVLAGIQQLA